MRWRTGSCNLSRMIRITHAISIDERELAESFIRASGPGGQNVNKLSTAVQRLVARIERSEIRDGLPAFRDARAGDACYVSSSSGASRK